VLTWFVTYKDGSKHSYHKENFNISHINKEKIDTLVIHEPSKVQPEIIIHFDDPRKRPIYVRRVEMPSPARPFKTVCHVVGWQMKVGDENVQSISYVFETQNRRVMKQSTIEGQIVNYEVVEDVTWIENAGAFNKERNGWFGVDPTQLEIIGSKAK
jgi:hypothetical protein